MVLHVGVVGLLVLGRMLLHVMLDVHVLGLVVRLLLHMMLNVDVLVLGLRVVVIVVI